MKLLVYSILIMISLAAVAHANALSGMPEPPLLYPAANSTANGAFQNTAIATMTYVGNYTCAQNQSHAYANAAGFPPCEFGSIEAGATGASPFWYIVPAYSGLSIFGFNSTNTTAQGFPVFNGSAVLTDCSAGATAASCADSPVYVYSPVFARIEKELNYTNGISGLPVGVLPDPSHSYIVSQSSNGIGSYAVAVFVFDPNIMPNAFDGKCNEVVKSNLTDPTGNCLTSVSALENALHTNSSSVMYANNGNPVWEAMGKPSAQAVLLGTGPSSGINTSNTNLQEVIKVSAADYYEPVYSGHTNGTSTVPTTVSTSTTPTTLPARVGGQRNVPLAAAAVVLIIIVLIVYFVRRKRSSF